MTGWRWAAKHPLGGSGHSHSQNGASVPSRSTALGLPFGLSVTHYCARYCLAAAPDMRASGVRKIVRKPGSENPRGACRGVAALGVGGASPVLLLTLGWAGPPVVADGRRKRSRRIPIPRQFPRTEDTRRACTGMPHTQTLPCFFTQPQPLRSLSTWGMCCCAIKTKQNSSW